MHRGPRAVGGAKLPKANRILSHPWPIEGYPIRYGSGPSRRAGPAPMICSTCVPMDWGASA